MPPLFLRILVYFVLCYLYCMYIQFFFYHHPHHHHHLMRKERLGGVQGDDIHAFYVSIMFLFLLLLLLLYCTK